MTKNLTQTMGLPFEGLSAPTTVVLPGHVTIGDDGSIVPYGLIADAMAFFGPHILVAAGLAATGDENQGGIYGFVSVLDAAPATRDRPSTHGLALLQTRYGWWDGPDAALVRCGIAKMSVWLDGPESGNLPVRVLIPTLPDAFPLADFLELAQKLWGRHARRVTLHRRVAPTLEQEIESWGAMPSVYDRPEVLRAIQYGAIQDPRERK